MSSSRRSAVASECLGSCVVPNRNESAAGARNRTMSTYSEKRFLPYTPDQLFALVAAVDRYPEFLPWCRAARIRSSEKLKGIGDKAVIVVDLVIGFRMIREHYTSSVMLQPPNRIDVTCVKGPFRYLDSNWIFEPAAASAEHPRGGHDVDVPYQVRVALDVAEFTDGDAVQ
jgi:coenzyme Q-binding protein COQ10